jgi:hypothetical protein
MEISRTEPMKPENQGSRQTMNSELKEIESLLSQASPSAVPAHWLHAIEARLGAPEESDADSEDKVVVPFPGRPRFRETRKAGSWNWWAAAAVAMLGALFAWFVPQDDDGAPIVVSSQRWNSPALLGIPAASRVGGAPASGVVPASVKSRIGSVRDEGVVWPVPGKAMRKIRVTYLDVVRARDDQGRTVEATIPRVQYVLVPERVD